MMEKLIEILMRMRTMEDDDFIFEETTTEDELKDFQKYIESQAKKQLSKFNDGKEQMPLDDFLTSINL